MTYRLPPLFTRDPGRLHPYSWAISPCGYPLLVRPISPAHDDAGPDRWHEPPLVVVDIDDLDLIADWWGDRTHEEGFTLAVGRSEDAAALAEAWALDRVDFALRVDTLAGLTAIRRLLNPARHLDPEQLHYLLADIGPTRGPGERRMHPSR